MLPAKERRQSEGQSWMWYRSRHSSEGLSLCKHPFYWQVCNELIRQWTDLNLYGARMKFACMFFILVLKQLHLCSVFLQWCSEADNLTQLVADVCLAVSQLLLQQWDLTCLLAHLHLRHARRQRCKYCAYPAIMACGFSVLFSAGFIIITTLLNITNW